MALAEKLGQVWERTEILTVKNALYAGAAIGGAYVVIKTYQKMSEGAESMGAAIGSSLAEIQQFINGSHKTEATRAGIVLQDKYVSQDGTVNRVWLNAIAHAHPDNYRIIQAIMNPDGKLKQEFWDYIGQEITIEDVQ